MRWIGRSAGDARNVRLRRLVVPSSSEISIHHRAQVERDVQASWPLRPGGMRPPSALAKTLRLCRLID